MGKSRSRTLLEKSVAAGVAAIEVYNKPAFQYREEAFAILMVNAWELLLKARLLALSGNRMSAIQVRVHRPRKDGSPGKRAVVKRNRAGNAQTISAIRALETLIASGEKGLDGACKANLELLVELRDNSVHYLNEDPRLNRKVQEVGTASLKNYLTLVAEWFGADLSAYNFFLMPLSFFHEFETAVSHSVRARSRQVEGLLRYLESLEARYPSDESRPFNISLRLETRFVRTTSADAVPFARTGEPGHITVMMAEEDIWKRFKWDSKALTNALKKRYSDFKPSRRYDALRREISKDPRFCRRRLLDPNKPHGLAKEFFSPDIVTEFDRHYTRRGATPKRG